MTASARGLCLSALLLVAAPCHAAAERRPGPPLQPLADLIVARPAFRTYTDRDGLPQNVVNAIAVDARGYVWIGTQSGPAYYNGHEWIAVDLPQRSVSNLVNQNALLVDSEGGIWFGTRNGGVSRLLGGAWTTFDTASGLASNNVNAIIESRAQARARPPGKRVLWFGTWGGGLSRLEDGRWTTFTAQSGLASDRVLSLLETVSPEGEPTLWVGTDGGGLSRYEKGSWTTFDTRSGLPDNKVWCLLESTDERGTPTLWIGTEAGGLARLREGRFTTVRAGSGLPSDSVYSLAETLAADGTRTLWAGTLGGGLARFRNGVWSVFDAESGLPNDLVRSLRAAPMTQGRQTLWIGTDGGGLTRLDDVAWTSLPVERRLIKNRVTAVLEAAEDDGGPALWIGTLGDGLLRLRSGVWTVFDPRAGLPSAKVRCLLQTTDEAGRRSLWVGTNAGLARLQGGRWTTYDSTSGLAGDVVFALLETRGEDGRRTLWVGTGGGLSRLVDGKWTTFTTRDGLGDNSVRSLLETTAGNGKRSLWVGTLGGLSRLDGGRWSSFDSRSGLPNTYVRSLLETVAADGGRTLWVGTDGGLACLDLAAADDPSTPFLNPMPPDITLPSNVIIAMAQDRQKRVYLFTLKGVVRLESPAAGSGAVTLRTFTVEDGLPSNECSAAATWVDRLGRIWAGTTTGVAVLDPSGEVPDAMPKPLYVERSFLGGRAYRGPDGSPVFPEGISLRHDQNHVGFEFALLSYFRELETRYRTQLVGFDAAPSAWDADDDKEYSNLREGRYVFRIWGKDYAGNVSGPVELPFSIRPAPWRTWWAYLAYLTAVAATGYGAMHVRLHVLHRRNLELEAKVAERTAKVLEHEAELSAANLRLEAANVDLARLNDLRSEFLGIASHELKNRLTIVMTSAELISTLSQERAEIVELAGAVAESSERMLALIKGLLDTAAGDVGHLKLVRVSTRLRVLGESVVEGCRTRAEAKRMTIAFRAEGDCLTQLDPEKMREVIENLVSNAIKYAEPGTAIGVEVRPSDGGIRLSVQDQGPGLTPEDKKKLFGRFQRLSAKPTGGESSTGLGLAIVKQLVELHDGRVWAESEPGHGATFIVEVPR